MEVESDEDGPAPAAPAQVAAPQEIPHHILMVENLPAVGRQSLFSAICS